MKILFSVLFFLCFGAMAQAQDANQAISAQDAKDHVGKTVWVSCDVKGLREAREEGKPNFINVGEAYPNHIFTVVVTGNFKEKYNFDLASLKGKTILVYGKVEMFKNLPQIKNPEKITVK